MGTPSSKLSDTLVIVPDWSATGSVPVLEEHKIALKFKDDLPNNVLFNLLKRNKAYLYLPSSPIIPENHCSKNLLQTMTKSDKFLWDLITTLKKRRTLEIHEYCMKNYEKDLRTRDLLFLENKKVIPAAAWGAFSSMLHESHISQFGLKFLAELI